MVDNGSSFKILLKTSTIFTEVSGCLSRHSCVASRSRGPSGHNLQQQHVWNYPYMRKHNKHTLELECAAVVCGDLYLEPHHGPHHVGLADNAVTELTTCRGPRLD